MFFAIICINLENNDYFCQKNSMEENLIIIEEPSDAGIRIDKFLASAIPDKSRSHYQKAIDNGLVLVNGKTVKSKKNYED